MAELHITKLAAARQQLRAAIRMFFAREDDLAIHTVASAAYRIISDLKSLRGRDEVGDYYSRAVFYSVQSYQRGTLPNHMADDPEMMDVMREWSEILPISENSDYEDLKATILSEMAKEFWKSRNNTIGADLGLMLGIPVGSGF